jgi:hypothetical protein
MKLKFFVQIVIVAIGLAQAGCGVFDTGLLGSTDTATVISKTAQIRTSYSVVAADLLEVKRGDRLDVVDQVEFEKVPWYRVRAHDDALTEGWIEAQNVITSATLAKSRKLYEDYQNQAPQAAGIIRSASNLRSAPDQSPENVLFKLANGSNFEIITWKFVPKTEAPDVDDSKAPQKNGKKSKNDEIEAAKEEGEPDQISDKYDIWYLVHLDPSVSPAPAGWLFGRQVELQVPSDISFFQQNNRKFTTWQRLDADSANKVGSGDKALAPGSWVILSRDLYSKPIDGVEPDFDGVMVLAFDKYDQNYYTVWRNPPNTEYWGSLPLKVEGKGDNKTFTVRLRGPSGKIDDKTFVVFKDKNRMRVTPPEDIAQYQTKNK